MREHFPKDLEVCTHRFCFFPASLVDEGRGECIYDVGVPLAAADAEAAARRGLTSEEMDASVATLRAVAGTLGAEAVLLRERAAPEDEGGGRGRNTAQYLVRRRYEEKDFMEIRIAVVGNVDAGEKVVLFSLWKNQVYSEVPAYTT